LKYLFYDNNKHQALIKYIQLQQTFDVFKMQAELALLEESWWQQHYNKAHYEGGWSVLSLRSIDGRGDNVISVHSDAGTHEWKDTPLLERCCYLQSVLSFFETQKNAVRLMKLEPSGVIKEHSDYALSFEEGEVRLHIPIVTNPLVEFYLQQERLLMQEGECWYLNLSLPHKVKNAGTTARVHLVIDCKVNDWVKTLLEKPSARYMTIDNAQLEKKYSAGEQLQIIAQLKLMNTVTSLELATKIEKEMK
jgi:hypothetical protein